MDILYKLPEKIRNIKPITNTYNIIHVIKHSAKNDQKMVKKWGFLDNT